LPYERRAYQCLQLWVALRRELIRLALSTRSARCRHAAVEFSQFAVPIAVGAASSDSVRCDAHHQNFVDGFSSPRRSISSVRVLRGGTHRLRRMTNLFLFSSGLVPEFLVSSSVYDCTDNPALISALLAKPEFCSADFRVQRR
jgi:hypothetical protein